MYEYTPNDCFADVKFLQWQTLYEKERPFQIFIEVPKDARDQRATNLIFEDVKQEFHDVRGRETSYKLDEHGFTYRHHHIDFENFQNREAVEAIYLPEIEKLLRDNVEGVQRIFFFDWRLRNSMRAPPGTAIDLNNPADFLRPALHAHVDQTPSAVLNRILMQLPEEADTLLRMRVRVINAWKPLKNPVEDWPLAVADGSKIRASHLVETDHVRRSYTGSNYNAMSSADFKWHYLDRQGPNEILLLKNFDSDTNVKARWCPHVSFKHPQASSVAGMRESIEVRAMVFTTTD